MLNLKEKLKYLSGIFSNEKMEYLQKYFQTLNKRLKHV